MSKFALASLAVMAALLSNAAERRDVTLKVFQFPANMIPRVDGNADDWNMVPAEYAVGTDMARGKVSFTDLSTGKIASWKWEFGDGVTSTEQNPVHEYSQGRDYTVTLTVEGPDGTSRLAKVWQVFVK